MDGKYIPGAAVRRRYGVCNNTLRKYSDLGRIRTVRVGDSGKRLYRSEDLVHIFAQASSEDEPKTRAKLCYARVSSRKQSEDLARLRQAKPGYEIVQDIASGISWKRPGLLSLLDRALRGDVEEIVVAHQDRLCRFAFELIEHVLRRSGCRVVVLDHSDRPSEEDSTAELRDDLLAIVTVFVASNNGRRSAINRRRRATSQQEAEDRRTASSAGSKEPEMEDISK
jgi:predicted site-specific integrase-resolvase